VRTTLPPATRHLIRLAGMPNTIERFYSWLIWMANLVRSNGPAAFPSAINALPAARASGLCRVLSHCVRCLACRRRSGTSTFTRSRNGAVGNQKFPRHLARHQHKRYTLPHP
jgi:hypothetical protein